MKSRSTEFMGKKPFLGHARTRLQKMQDHFKAEAKAIHKEASSHTIGPGKTDKIKRIAVLVLLYALVFLGLSLYIPFPRGKLESGPVVSLSLVDRNDTVLREILSDEGGRCEWVGLGEVSPDLVRATVVAEDRVFYLHPGVNPWAVVRAVFQNIRHRRVVSGASTISQQVVRNIYRNRRTVFAKMVEVWLALRLEHTISKEKILTQYLNRIYYGNQAYGIAAASELYFDKPAGDLSLAEAAFLASLPRSPNALDPYRHFKDAKKRQEHILRQMHEKGDIDEDRWKRARAEPLKLVPARKNFRAPHFCDFVLSQIPVSVRQTSSRIRTTCDYSLQEKIERLVEDHIEVLEEKNISNAAVVVLDNRTGEILSMVGSKDFFDARHDGQVNGALSLRQPGSTLKPFTYGLGLERGMTAADILEDRDYYYPTPKGSYSPRNYDEKFHGAVRVRHALACSYNVPAVSLLEKLGTDLLYQRLKTLGFESLDKSPAHYGVGLTLGNGEVTLLELTRAYASIARGGLSIGDRAINRCYDPGGREIVWQDREKPRRIFSEQIAFIITDILSDRDARSPAFGYLSPLNLPFDCAVKTGTSVDFRDNWTIGYTPRYTVGVWVGNFDAKPMHNVSGVTGCGPLFKDIMLLLENKNPEAGFIEAEDVVRVKICPLSGRLATENCPGAMEEVFIEGTEPSEQCWVHTGEGRSAALSEFHKGRSEALSESRKGRLEALREFREREYEAIRESREGKVEVIRESREGGLEALREFREDEFSIEFPSDGDTFKMDPVLRAEFQRIKLKVTIPAGMAIDSVEWWVDKQKISTTPYPYAEFWHMMPGEHTIRATAVAGEKLLTSTSIKIRIYGDGPQHIIDNK